MINLTYACSRCPFKTGVLDLAQLHANNTKHAVSVHGTITAQVTELVEGKTNAAAVTRAREAVIMRIARDKGLVPKK